MRVGELVGEPRLAHPGLADDGDHLAPAGVGLAQDPAQVRDLCVAAHEAREAAEGRGLQPRPRLSRPRQLEDLDRVREALHGDGPERSHLDVALGEPHGVARQPHGPGRRQLFHPGREVSGLAHGRVIHAEIAADRAHDDLPRVQAHPDLYLHPVRAARVVRVALERLLHP